MRTLLFTLTAVLLLAACTPEEVQQDLAAARTAGQHVVKGARNLLDGAVKQAPKSEADWAKYREAVAGGLADLKQSLVELQAKIDKAAPGERARLKAQADQVGARLREAESKLAKLAKEHGGDVKAALDRQAESVLEGVDELKAAVAARLGKSGK